MFKLFRSKNHRANQKTLKQYIASLEITIDSLSSRVCSLETDYTNLKNELLLTQSDFASICGDLHTITATQEFCLKSCDCEIRNIALSSRDNYVSIRASDVQFKKNETEEK